MMTKKLIAIVMSALCLTLPLGAMAANDDEVTIRVMGMHEQSKDAVMQIIELPAAVREQARQHDEVEARQQGDAERNIEAERIQIEKESFEQAAEQMQEINQGSSPKN